ncbi:MAG: type II toxin-antitoxin system PemK/MazF family toxin [Sedimentibacter sp.]
MARVEFSELDKIIRDLSSETRIAKDGSIPLSQFLNLLSNFADKANSFTESDLSLFTKSFQQYLNRRTFKTCRETVNVGDIFNVDFGINYEPEMSYNHPALILEVVGDLVLVVPTSTSPSKLSNAYHPKNNPSGCWYYYEVSKSDGFAEKCTLILGNVCTISQGRLLEKKGHLTEDINKNNSLYKQVKHIILEKVFYREYNSLTNELCDLTNQNKKLLEEIKSLKNKE